MARYKTLTKTFIAPTWMDEGTIFDISDDFIPGPHLEAQDAGGEAALAAFYEEHPNAKLPSAEDLGLTLELFQPAIVALAPKGEEHVLTLAEANAGAKAQ